MAQLPAGVASDECTAQSFEQSLSKMNVSFQLGQYIEARTYGEAVFACARFQEKPARRKFIFFLNRLNHIYLKLNQLNEVYSRVEDAYLLSTQHLGLRHEITMQSRDLFFKALVDRQDYAAAIAVASENIEVSEGLRQEVLRKHHYLIQLYSLYGLTQQYEKEADTLRTLIDLTRQLFGKDDEELARYKLDLAKSYCRQGANKRFRQTVAKYNLKYRCD